MARFRRADIARRGLVDPTAEGEDEVAFRVELLDPVIAVVGHIDIAIGGIEFFAGWRSQFGQWRTVQGT